MLNISQRSTRLAKAMAGMESPSAIRSHESDMQSLLRSLAKGQYDEKMAEYKQALSGEPCSDSDTQRE